ncbi:hypothetical protein [Pseudomonas panipatensis]|uniref:hypothetical protein n=1 Tax=Pseudomonas panipatensis TaxID=428992 RepID=UPI0035B46920
MKGHFRKTLPDTQPGRKPGIFRNNPFIISLSLNRSRRGCVNSLAANTPKRLTGLWAVSDSRSLRLLPPCMPPFEQMRIDMPRQKPPPSSRPSTGERPGLPRNPAPRRLKALLLLCLLGSSALPAPVPAAEPSNDIERFVRALYLNYQAKGKPVRLNDPRADTLITADLRAVIGGNAKALNGAAGLLDTDPLCACRQHDLSVEQLSISMNGEKRASVSVTFINQGWRRTTRLSLAKTRAGWRIDDVAQPNMPSLRRALEKESRSAIAQRSACARQNRRSEP